MIINVDQVITRTKARLRLMETTEADAYINLLIDEAARGLNAENTKTIQCEDVEIDCGRAKLPDNYSELYFFMLDGGCCNGCSHTDAPEPTPPNFLYCSCPSIYYYDKSAMIGDNCDWYGNAFYIQNGYIFFPSTNTATHVKVYFYGFNVKDGMMVVSDDQERALSAYAAFQYANEYPESYTPEQRRNWNAEWVAQKNWLNGNKILKEFKLQKPQISLIANAVLINRRRGGFGR
jgi:nitrite reductase/ring-hydroxylating ferredoxin subunit